LFSDISRHKAGLTDELLLHSWVKRICLCD